MYTEKTSTMLNKVLAAYPHSSRYFSEFDMSAGCVPILDAWADILSAGPQGIDDSLMALSGLSFEDMTIQDCYKAIRNEYIRRWLSGVTRDHITSTCNTLSMVDAQISIYPDIELNARTLADAWSAANPEQTPVKATGTMPC